MTPAKRSPGYQPHTRGVAELVHFALFLAVEEVVVILHADEFRPAVFLSAELNHGELVGPHAAGADVVDFS